MYRVPALAIRIYTPTSSTRPQWRCTPAWGSSSRQTAEPSRKPAKIATKILAGFADPVRRVPLTLSLTPHTVMPRHLGTLTHAFTTSAYCAGGALLMSSSVMAISDTLAVASNSSAPWILLDMFCARWHWEPVSRFHQFMSTFDHFLLKSIPIPSMGMPCAIHWLTFFTTAAGLPQSLLSRL